MAVQVRRNKFRRYANGSSRDSEKSVNVFFRAPGTRPEFIRVYFFFLRE